ncbi:MAG: adenylate/guanylate cyclase domain-containing protein [Candidatus Sericytochromatia bacterium]|nr:adenylate/guanylate cyclase domain-containing protein [Candidatus Sericytochromatia bacterium]
MKRTLIYLLMGLGVAIFVSVTGLVWSVPQRVELSLYNQRMETLGARVPNKQIVIIDIDEASMDRVGTWPWRRSVHADLLHKLRGWGAKVIAYDVYFLKESPFPEDDARHAAEIKEAKDVVIASMFSDQYTTKLGEDDSPSTPTLITPLAMLGGLPAYVNYSHDMDAQIRRSNGLQRQGANSFAYQVVKLWQPERAPALEARYGLDQYLLHFSGPPQSYVTVSYTNVLNEVLDPRADPRLNELIEVPAGVNPEKFTYKDLFKDKIVLIGSSAGSLHDVFATPFVGSGDSAKVRNMAGVEIHANHIDTLLRGDEYVDAPGWQNIAVTIVVSLLFASLIGLVGPLTGLLAAVTIGIAYLTLNGLIFSTQHYWLNLFDPLVALGVDYGVLFAYRFFVEEREKRRVRGTLNRYVSPKAVTELLKDESAMPSLRSQRRLVTILFSDIAGFTTMSEQMPVDEVERILNEYLTAMTQIVFDNDGTLDKYIGDAVMAVWGNVGSTDPAGNALRASKTAIEMQEKLSELRQKWLSEGMVPLQVRIGLNTGEALCGNFGSPLKMDFTVIGDTVNTAARLEGLNKDMNTNIMISHSTYELVKDHTTTRYLGPISAKGKAEKILVYELSGWRGGDSDVFGAKTQVTGQDGTMIGRRLTKMGSTIFGSGTRTGSQTLFGNRPPSDHAKTQTGQTAAPGAATTVGQATQAGGKTLPAGLRGDFARTRTNSDAVNPPADFGATSPGTEALPPVGKPPEAQA